MRKQRIKIMLAPAETIHILIVGEIAFGILRQTVGRSGYLIEISGRVEHVEIIDTVVSSGHRRRGLRMIRTDIVAAESGEGPDP